MKITFRTGVFETNSSSTHSLIILSEEEYKKLEAKELYISWNDKLVTREEVLEEAKKAGYDDIDSYNEDYDEYKTLDKYFDSEYLETFQDTYTTKSGEKVYAIGKYGYGG